VSAADDQGRFAVTLGPGEWLIHASLGDQGLADRNSVKVSEGHALRPLILRLTPQGRLRVRLVEAETGKPIVGGRLVVDNGLDPNTDQDGASSWVGSTGSGTTSHSSSSPVGSASVCCLRCPIGQ